MIIPNEVIKVLLWIRISLFLLTGLFKIGMDSVGFVDSLLGLIIISVPFLLLRCISKYSIGMGDIKLLAVVGVCVGSSRILIISVLALVAAVIVSSIKMVRKRLDKREAFSFAPFIAFGTILVVLMG